ncbi:helix-hairpin-helix domain-containing protein [Chryseobacterium sp. cx-311]|uniref:helix-hairpin-helix domain-containing protein n=1 Tax=Marnyiella aurantia TaxID=2758037 RepID=UPI001AE79524|nr:helix-hairpin-helix domain-containing protein [Marnyiella aurantia]MBP0613718.1 helix-hairpin-helix domain-containing protein [Marnyiella aurantia]
MNSTLQFTIARKHFIIICILVLAVVAALAAYRGSIPAETERHGVPEFAEVESGKSIVLSEFDPNELDAGQWMALGFSEKQAATILKYRQVVGGTFTSKEQFKKCYAVSDSRYEELEPYLLLPEKGTSAVRNAGFSYKPGRSNFSSKKTITIPGKFNPDTYSQQDWEKLGFSGKQASAILKYRSYLGGSFISKEKFKECFIISEENYARLEPYLILPEKETATNAASGGRNGFSRSEARNTVATKISEFDPNLLDMQGWIGLGFSEKQANVIMNYRNRILKGSFKSKEDLKNCFVVSEQKYAELQPYINLNPENIGRRNGSGSVQGQISGPATDFSKVDINEITADQLIEFGFDERAARNYVSFRKKLGGFAAKNQVFESYDIDRELAQKLIDISPLNLSKVERYTVAEAPESWLKTHPYFRYSADKIIYYRLSNSDEKKIWKLVNAKPEYLAKMKLYLK